MVLRTPRTLSSTVGILLLALCSAGCQSSSRSICEAAEECDWFDNSDIDVKECMDRINDGVDDEHYDQEDVNECDDCLRDQGDDCNDYILECADECGDIYGEVIFNL